MSDPPRLVIDGRTLTMRGLVAYIGGPDSMDPGFGHTRLARLQADALGNWNLIVENGVAHTLVPEQQALLAGRRYLMSPDAGIVVNLDGHVFQLNWPHAHPGAAPATAATATQPEPSVSVAPRPASAQPTEPLPTQPIVPGAVAQWSTNPERRATETTSQTTVHAAPQSPGQAAGTGGRVASPWTFSFLGLFWLAIAILLFITRDLVAILIGLAALAYSVYLFRGGRFRILVW